MTAAGRRQRPTVRRSGLVPAAAVLAGAFLLTGCASGGSGADRGSPAASDRGAGATSDDRLVPPGFGTLPQDEVTLSLRRGELLLKVTPLAEEVIRLTAPDTYERLSGLKERHREALARRSGSDRPSLFVVSFFSYEPDVPFDPEDVHLLNRGLRFRPAAIRAVTPGWGTQRLNQERIQMAVYAYPPEVDLDQELEIQYQGVRRGGWERILRVIEAERARVRARSRSRTEGFEPGPAGRGRDPASGGDPTGTHTSSSYFRIFR